MLGAKCQHRQRSMSILSASNPYSGTRRPSVLQEVGFREALEDNDVSAYVPTHLLHPSGRKTTPTSSNRSSFTLPEVMSDGTRNVNDVVEETHNDLKEHLDDRMKQLVRSLRELYDSNALHKYMKAGEANTCGGTNKLGNHKGRQPKKDMDGASKGSISESIIDLCSDGDVAVASIDLGEPRTDVHEDEDTFTVKESLRTDIFVGKESDASSSLLPGRLEPLCDIGARLQQPDDPHSLFEVLEVWRKQTKHVAATMGTKVASDHMPASVSLQDLNRLKDDNGGTEAGKNPLIATGLWAKIVFDPQSRSRFSWEIFSIVLVLYDVIWLPLLLFDPPAIDLTIAMSWICRLFWTSDIAMTLITGYMTVEGLIDYRPFHIAKRYIKSWFGLDILVVGVDWLEIVFEEAQAGGFARMGRVGRIFRMARMVRLLRVLRLQFILQHLMEYLRSELIKELTVLFKILFVITGLGHFFACIWYGIGAREEEEYTWVKTTFLARHALGYRYATSLHWSLSQFSGGLDFVEAENLFERCYCVLVWIFGFTLGAVMISALTASWTHVSILANDKTQKVTILRKYLTDNKIPYKLANRLQRNALHTMVEMERTRPEHSVDLLNLVSTPLCMELHFELHYRILRNHPFFEKCGIVCNRITQKICHFAVTTMNVSEGDVVFNVGEIPPRPKMVFVHSGLFKYYDMAQMRKVSEWHNAEAERGISSMNLTMSPVPDKVLEELSNDSSANGRLSTKDASSHEYTHLRAGYWIAEPFLWTHWMCRGLLIACADSQLVLVDAHAFQEILGSYYDDMFSPRVYATEFVNELNECQKDVSDITFGMEEKAMDRFNMHMHEKMLSARPHRLSFLNRKTL